MVSVGQGFGEGPAASLICHIQSFRWKTWRLELESSEDSFSPMWAWLSLQPGIPFTLYLVLGVLRVKNEKWFHVWELQFWNYNESVRSV